MQYYINENTKEQYAFEDGVTPPAELGALKPITQEEAIANAAAYQQKLQDALPYNIKRIQEYPSIGDQLDALYKAGVFPPEMAAQIAAVKEKYPKP